MTNDQLPAFIFHFPFKKCPKFIKLNLKPKSNLPSFHYCLQTNFYCRQLGRQARNPKLATNKKSPQPIFINHYQLSIINYQLSIIHSQLFTFSFELLTFSYFYYIWKTIQPTIEMLTDKHTCIRPFGVFKKTLNVCISGVCTPPILV